MGGSRLNFIYEDDTTTNYIVNLDEGNGRAAGFQVAQSAAELALPTLPKYFRMRYVMCASDTGIKRKIYVPTIANPLWTGADRTVSLPVFNNDTTASARNFTTTSRIGERKRFLANVDTGQTDQPGTGLTPAAPVT